MKIRLALPLFCSLCMLLPSPALADTGHFSYMDQSHWMFESGKTQSPIDIQTAIAQPMRDAGIIKLDHNPITLDVVDNHHTIQVGSHGTAVINGRGFQLLQYHFHAPSEHTLDGKFFPVEVHFVHKAQNGRLAVIGVFFVEGEANPAFGKMLASIKKGASNTKAGVILNSDLLPTNFSYYHYLGSLTTPPLSENVEWYVMRNPVELSAAQIKEFQKYYDGNNRKVQPLNGRPLLLHAE